MEDRSPTSSQRFLKYRPLLPRLMDPFPPQEKTLCLKSSHPFWNGYSIGEVVSQVNATKKLRKIKQDDTAGLIDGTLIMSHRFEQNDLQIPAIMTLDWYRSKAIEENAYEELRKSVIKKIKIKNKNTGSFGKDWTIYKGGMGNIPLELSINGNITFNGNLVFENKDLVTTNQRDNKNWDMEIEQTQRFNIMGNIGDRFFIDIKQDSEADFSWENDFNIEYRGQENEILQRAEAGNINLNLVGMDAVNMGGNNSSLFGIKAVYQFGPVEMQSVIAREMVKKSEKTMTGGTESDVPISIKDYNFLVDRYFFIDDSFRNNFYPLNENYQNQYYEGYVIGNYEVYQMVTTSEGNPITATAYIDPKNPEDSYNKSGIWKRLEENLDYEINRYLGYIRVNSVQSAIAIAYTTTSYNIDAQSFNMDNQNSTGTNFKQEHIDCLDNNTDDSSVCDDLIKLKLIKDIYSSTPSSPTWPLMFKNVYSLGGSNIDPNGLEVDIVRDLGADLQKTHSDSGHSYLSIFGLDSEDQNQEKVEGGDGKMDLYESIINYKYGELIIPAYLPFAYDTTPRTDEDGNYILDFKNDGTYWGTNHSDLNGVLIELNDADGNFSSTDMGPAMYYDNIMDNSIDEHEFVIKVKTSTRSSSMNLGGFMIVEGSETVRLGSQILQKDVDYTIDYFSGTINFISEDALDPGAEISISYEEKQFISFDQKLLIGTYMKYTFGENNYLAGGMFYYNQSIAEEKIDIGYEPMRNFAWNITGKYQDEWGFLTRAVDLLPLIQTTKSSQFSVDGNYAEIIPNPNPLGQAFIDDFESAKRTSSLSILQRHWKMASPPDTSSQESSQTVKTRGRMIWYNPYEDEPTKNIWPEQSTSTQANNNTTKILKIETEFQGDEDDTLWNGIMIPLYSSEYNQSQSKYMDIWLNAEDVWDDSLRLYIDIGHISEDLNDNGVLDTEDEPVYGYGIGDDILSDGEDIGVDNCTNSYEDGWGGCLCNKYLNAIYDSDLSGIYTHPTEFCEEGTTYEKAVDSLIYYPNIVDSSLLDPTDPNGDNWSYIEGSDDFSFFNGTEGNGQAMGYRYPDTEDMDKNKTLDTRNTYFTFSIDPHQDKTQENSMVVTETEKNLTKTGWKLFRLPLISFDEVGDPDWEDVRSFRLRVESFNFHSDSTNLLKIAKIELVENEWKELGIAPKDTLDSPVENHFFSVEVINTDESTEYNNKLKQLNIIREHDEYNDIDMKEQSLVLSFVKDQEDPDSSGLDVDYAGLIKNTFPALSSDKSLSYFAYEKMEMYIYGGDPESNSADCWYDTYDPNLECEPDSVDFLFRFGKDDDDNYYEIRQPIYEGWDDKNHLDINIDKLTQLKIPIINSPAEILDDVGLDGFESDFESGCIGDDEYSLGHAISYTSILEAEEISTDSSFWVEIHYPNGEEGSAIPICGQLWWNDLDINCITCSNDDPNGDNYDSTNNPQGTENNDNKFDSEDLNGDGDITAGEAEPPVEDHNGDGIYNENLSYDIDNDLYVWDNQNDIKKVCHNCTEIRLKGEPSINNIQNIVMGVVNNATDRIYGKVLVNELRMTGVKKSKETSYNISGSLNFADLMTISGSYKHKDAGFHKLQQRLGTGNSDDTYSATIKLNPNIILPHKWGIKTPVTLNYSNSIFTPKYYPGSDIITDTEDINFNIEDIQTRNEKISFSTSFRKNSRSTNWFIKRTLDNITISYSNIKTSKSNSQIQKETKNDLQVSGDYAYNWGKENYYSPFKFTKDWLIIGTILSQSRYYYTPDKFSASIQLNESDKRTIQRVNIDNITKTYSFNMRQKFTLNHKFTKTLSSNYSRQIDSNLDLDRFKNDKWKIIKDMDPGRVETMSEKFTNTYAPDFLKWLNPNFTFNPTYNWNLNIIDTVQTADVKSSTTFKAKISLNLQDFIELIYTPENKGNSSRGRGRSRSSSNSNKNGKKINIQNPIARLILGEMHSLTSKLRSISSTYTYSTSHKYDNIAADLIPSYLYRFGLQKSPITESGSMEYVTSNNLVGSSAHSYSTDFRTSTNINIIPTINTSLEFKHANSLSNSTTSITENKSFSYYPLGSRGDKGFPMANWSINWSKIEKLWILKKLFKSVSLNHGFNGEQSMSYSNSELLNEQYSFAYSPLIGINSTTKGPNPITITANYNLHQTIKNINESTERNQNNQMSITIKLKKSGGIRMKTFFFRDFYIKNNMDFSLTCNYNTDRKLMTTVRVSDIADFNEHSKSMAWSVKPNMSYSFTRWVTGNFYMIYGISEDKTTGRKEEKDFGFNMNIKIQG